MPGLAIVSGGMDSVTLLHEFSSQIALICSFNYGSKHNDKEIPFGFSKFRDTRSLIDGLSWGSGLKNWFIPDDFQDKFIAHDPCHDVAMDVTRIQYLVRAIS